MKVSESIVREARAQIGTPFRHQGRIPGVALDCVGLLVVVGRGCGLRVADETTYPRETDGEVLRRCLEAVCRRIPVRGVEPGDILIFLRGASLWHAGIVTKQDPLTMVHAWARFSRSRVREEVVSGPWRARIESAWRYEVA